MRPTGAATGPLGAPGAIDGLRRALQTSWPALVVDLVEEIGSTNTALLQALRGRGPHTTHTPHTPHTVHTPHGPHTPRLLVARRQTAGRGRLGRTWHAQADASLTFSLGLRLHRPDLSGLSLAVGVAIAQALDPSPPPERPRIGLKWPNDLWLHDPRADSGGRKLGGILIETTGNARERWGVIGVGLNILPLGSGEFASGLAWLQEIAPGTTTIAALHRIAPALMQALDRFEREGLPGFVEAFRARDLLQGRQVTTTSPEVPLGRAEGIDEAGALRVRDPSGRLHVVTSGEVSIRLAEAAAGASPPRPASGVPWPC